MKTNEHWLQKKLTEPKLMYKNREYYGFVFLHFPLSLSTLDIKKLFTFAK